MNIKINMGSNGNNDLDQAKRMLREIAHLAEEASLTGGIKTGVGRLAEYYNRVLRKLHEEGEVSESMFEALDPETADFGRIAVDANMLEASLGGGRRREGSDEEPEEQNADVLCGLAPFLGSEELGLLVKAKLEAGVKIGDHVLMGLAPFLESKMLSDLVRVRLTVPQPPKPPVAPEPPTPASQPTVEEPVVVPVDTTALASMGSTAERIQELAQQLNRPDLSESERGELLQQIGALTWPRLN